MSRSRRINPTALSCPEEKTILGYFLSYSLPPRVFLDVEKNALIQPTQCWLKNDSYVVSVKAKACLKKINILPPSTITFNYTLLKAKSGHTLEAVYHVLSGTQLGKGAFGNVEEIIGRVKVGNDYSAVYKPIARVAKFFEYYPEYQERIYLEFSFLRRLPNTGPKPPLQLTENLVVLIMRRIKGETIETILNNHKEGNRTLTVDERINISLSLVISLKRLHILRILHRDVKPGNFIYDLGSKEGELIDLGLSGDAINKDYCNVGTPIYSPPERLENRDHILKEPLTEATDLFSLGCVLSLIWGANKNAARNLTEVLKLARNCKFHNLFSGITDEELIPSHKAKINYFTHALTRSDPKERQPLDDVIYELLTIAFERHVKPLDDSLQQMLSETYRIGMELRGRLENLSEAYLKKPISKRYLDRLNHIFIEKLRLLPDDPQALHIIFILLHSHPFTSHDTKESILQKLASFTHDIEVLYSTLEKQKEIAFNYQNHAIVAQHDTFLNTIKNIYLRNKALLETPLPLSLTELDKHISRCKKYALRHEMHLKCIDSRVSQRQLTDNDMRDVITLFSKMGVQKKKEEPIVNRMRNG